MNNSSGRGNYRSGRGGRGRGRYRSQRSSGKYKNKKSNSSSNEDTKEYKFHPQSPGKHNYATYASVKEKVVQYVQKNFESGIDMAKSLKNMEYVDIEKDKPVRDLAKSDDKALKEQIQKGLDIEYAELYRRFNDRKEDLKNNKPKCYATIMANYCTQTMRSRIEEHPDLRPKLMMTPLLC